MRERDDLSCELYRFALVIDDVSKLRSLTRVVLVEPDTAIELHCDPMTRPGDVMYRRSTESLETENVDF